jgi:hypothetical protein
MQKMMLSEPVYIPAEYREVVLRWLQAYWRDRMFEWQNNFGMMPDIEDMPARSEDYLRLMVADSISQMARAAAGETEGLERGIVYEGVQSLVERLFCPPGAAGYSIPPEFWESDFGWMVLRAFLWSQGDELMTISEAAEVAGKSVKYISDLARRGKLTVYKDPSEPNPRRATRVLRSEVEGLVE